MAKRGGCVPVGNKQAGSKRWLKVWLITLVVFGIFSFGYGLGSGNISFGSSLPSQNNALPANLNISSVEQVYDLLRKSYDGELDYNELLEGMKRGMVNAAGDPHTEYLTPDQTTEFDEDLNGTFSGIGAELGKDGDSIIVIAPIAGFPADKAGIKPKDIIVEVDGESTYGWSVSEAVKNIRGPEGSEVKLRIIRENKEDLELTIRRQNITIPSVESKILDGNVGYIKISRFSEDTSKLVDLAAQEFASKSVSGVVLDLRANPGGLLNAAVDVSNLWLADGKTILQEKRDDTVIKTYSSRGSATLGGVNTVVLIDEGSASASEIVAGALSDNEAAVILGQTSYGKGSVQSLESLSNGGSLKVTIARWYTPSGRNIDKEGIEPDVKVEQIISSTSDSQLVAAIEQITSR